MKSIFLLTTLLLFYSCQSNGQQKKQITAGAASPKINANAAGAKEFLQEVHEKDYPGLKAGDIAPDAVTIEADNIVQVVNGLCIMTKGNQQALIDLKGNFILKWSDARITSYPPFSTLFVVANGIDARLFNVKGQAIFADKRMHHFTDIDARKFANTMIGTNDVFIDRNGRIMPEGFVSNLERLDERELYTKPQSSLIKFRKNGKCGYWDMSGKTAIAAQYDDAGEFTDGLAPVMKIDQFGTAKWGYINPAGQLVIPFTYQIRPGQFHDGLALVQPVDNSEFKYAYIDKAGAIKFKLPLNIFPSKLTNESNYTKTNGAFISGYALWRELNDEKLVDTFGNILDISSLLKYAYVRSIDNTGFYMGGYNDKGIYFLTSKKALPFNCRGMIDWKGKLLFPPAFEFLAADFYSTYANATCKVSGNGFDRGTGLVKGVVNSKGIFVLTLAEKSKF